MNIMQAVTKAHRIKQTAYLFCRPQRGAVAEIQPAGEQGKTGNKQRNRKPRIILRQEKRVGSVAKGDKKISMAERFI